MAYRGKSRTGIEFHKKAGGWVCPAQISPDIENIHVLLKYTKIYQSTTFLNSGRLPDFFLAFCAFLPAFCGYVWWCFSREMSEVCVCLPDLKILPPNEDG